jgi:hypothetical protein
MTEAIPFSEVKLICGLIASEKRVFKRARHLLSDSYGEIEILSPLFPFVFTDYYEKQMGKNLCRQLLSFKNCIPPDELADIKIHTNSLEEEIKKEFKASHRIVNIDPGFLSASALVMATAKDFAHRIPLKKGIYAHLELLFGRKNVRSLDWTYPDFRTKEYQEFLLSVRQKYLKKNVTP